MEYTPYGQQWIDEGTDRSIITYRFTSKEYDSETGLYYYGVRYLDPVTARWMTPDPALGRYLPATPTSIASQHANLTLPANGGVFNLFNLNPYGYSANNPVKYQDPTGEFFIPYTSDQLMSDGNWNTVRLNGGGPKDTVGAEGCLVTAVSNMINTITGRDTVTPGELAKSNFVAKGDMSRSSIQAALRFYTGNQKLTVGELPPGSNPQAVKATLAGLQKSSSGYLVIGGSNILFKNAAHALVPSRHFLDINGVSAGRSGGLSISAQPTSENDVLQQRSYGSASGNPKKGQFRVDQLLFVKIPGAKEH